MKRITLAVLAVCFLAISLAGCTTVGNKNQSDNQYLEPKIATRFYDVPVPAGFKLLPKESYSFEADGIRAGVLKYKGRANADMVVNFYKDQMVMNGWDFLNIVEFGQRQLNFDRDTETCVINISSSGRSSTVTISIGPKSRKAPRRVDKPVK